jgi:hypothetical protein
MRTRRQAVEDASAAAAAAAAAIWQMLESQATKALNQIFH